MTEEINCTICLHTLKNKQQPNETLPCGHTFHQQCLSDWRKTSAPENRVCPVCRNRFEAAPEPATDVRIYVHEHHQPVAHIVEYQPREQLDDSTSIKRIFLVTLAMILIISSIFLYVWLMVKAFQDEEQIQLFDFGFDAKGFIAIGLFSRGFISLGVFSLGILSFGLISIGIVVVVSLLGGGIGLGLFGIGFSTYVIYCQYGIGIWKLRAKKGLSILRPIFNPGENHLAD